MSPLRRANAALQPCRRGHKGGVKAGERTPLPERDRPSVARDGFGPPDMVCAAHRRQYAPVFGRPCGAAQGI